jgi:hypothetical protein
MFSSPRPLPSRPPHCSFLRTLRMSNRSPAPLSSYRPGARFKHTEVHVHSWLYGYFFNFPESRIQTCQERRRQLMEIRTVHIGRSRISSCANCGGNKMQQTEREEKATTQTVSTFECRYKTVLRTHLRYNHSTKLFQNQTTAVIK